MNTYCTICSDSKFVLNICIPVLYDFYIILAFYTPLHFILLLLIYMYIFTILKYETLTLIRRNFILHFSITLKPWSFFQRKTKGSLFDKTPGFFFWGQNLKKLEESKYTELTY